MISAIAPATLQPSKKLEHYGTSVFARVAQMAVKHQAINIAQGFPNFNFSDKLLDFHTQYLKQGFNQYAPSNGDTGLKEQVALKMYREHGADYHPDTEITITTGALQAVYTVLTSIVEKGDEVIVFEPAFDSYRPVIELNGGRTVGVVLFGPDYEIDWDLVRLSISSKTRAIILNTPNNPTGKTLKKQDYLELIKLVRDTNIVIISDEVYEYLVFDDKPHLSVADFPELRQRSFVISSFGKTLHVTGWRVGYCLAPDYLMEGFRRIHQFMVFSACSHASQKAIARFLEEEAGYEREVNEIYRKKRAYFSKGIACSRFNALPVEASFFMLLDYTAINKKESSEKMTEELIVKHKLATIPISAFYSAPNNETLIRICFAKSQDVLDQAIEILSKV